MEKLFTREQLNKMVTKSIWDIIHLTYTYQIDRPNWLLGKGTSKMNKTQLVAHIKELDNKRLEILATL